MAHKNAGTIVDTDGGEIEVWVEHGPDGQPAHVFLSANNSQLGDFVYGQPFPGDAFQSTAQRVAAGEAKRLTVFDTEAIATDAPADDAVIEPFDSPTYKTLRSWPGDGRTH